MCFFIGIKKRKLIDFERMMAMSYKLMNDILDTKGFKVALAKKDGSYDFTKEELIDYLHDNLMTLPGKVRANHWHLVVEKDGVPVKDADFDYYLAMYNITEEEMETERVNRLKSLRLEETALKDAIKNKTMWISENTGLPWNANYFLSGYTYEKEVKRAMEKVLPYGGVPYFAIVDHVRDGGIWVSLLYISLHKEYWGYERVSREGTIDSGVYNSALDCMDFGQIQIKVGLGGSVKRVA